MGFYSDSCKSRGLFRETRKTLRAGVLEKSLKNPAGYLKYPAAGRTLGFTHGPHW